MARRTWVILLTLATIVALCFVCTPAVREFIAVDRCMDSGGCWVRSRHRCEYAQANCKP
ncbi:MAG TPA: hypothetical protein VFK85_00215 [Anaeromyxobacteraceae bacterium]|nr:hypothetical protein [Anaeromyxobacteraceae bacterium]